VRKLMTFLTVVALVGATATSALAQVGRTELRGTITDETGGAMPGVTVFIQNEADGTFREVITGGEGTYFAAQLLPGTFTVTATLPGFTTYQTTGYALRVGQTTPLDIVLGVGTLEETVTVTGQAPLVDLTSAEVGGTLDAQEMIDMPLQNRSAFAAISLLPGIQFLPSAGDGNDTIIANGQTSAASSLNVDGGYNGSSTSGGGGGSQVKVAIESVAEFQVVSGQFDAEFGRSSGAIINAVTKRGTNQWSGAGFSYNTTSAMTARNYFNAQQFAADPSVDKPANTKFEFGGVFGGPIVTDTAHFFFSVERRMTDPARATTFASRPELSWSANEKWRATNFMGRLDHQINSSNTWAFRYLKELSPQENEIGARTELGSTNRNDDDYMFVGSYTSVLGNNIVNTARVTRSYEDSGGGPPAWFDLGGNVSLDGQMRNLSPSYEMDSFRDGVAPWGWSRKDVQWQYNNTTSVFVPDKMGDHDFKFGGTFHRSYIDDFTENLLGGEFYFATDMPFNVDDFSTYPERMRIRVGKQNGRQFDYPINTAELFFQDKWTLDDRWTIGLGVRYDAEFLNAKLTDNPLMTPGTDPRDWNNISPRLSIAYDLTGDGRSVLRAGYGFFYDRTLFSGLDNVLQDPILNDSFVASFPRGGGDQGGQEDPGPRNGMPIQDPDLAQALHIGSAAAGECGPATTRDGATHCPLVNHDFIKSIYPGSATRFNEANTFIDNYRRQQPLFGQFTVGFERELMPTLSVAMDYVNIRGSQLLNRINYVAPLRDGINSSDELTWYDVFPYQNGPGGGYTGVYNRTDTVNYPSCPHAVGAGYYSDDVLLAAQCAKAGPDGIDPRTGLAIGVWQGRLLSIESTGFSAYDGLNFSMEKRYSDRWGMRLSYALGYSRGDTFEQYGTNGISVNGVQTQVLDDLNMDLNWQPAEHDRKHVLTLSGRTELPGGITVSPIFRYMSANPFTMYNSKIDLDRNGTLWDPIPAGSYTGVGSDAFTVEHDGRQGGARKGDYINLDLRLGYRVRPTSGDTLDIYFDIINMFNRANFFVASYASGDQNSANFARFTALRSGGVPRQANFGVRYGF
jgi:hypothetical protein